MNKLLYPGPTAQAPEYQGPRYINHTKPCPLCWHHIHLFTSPSFYHIHLITSHKSFHINLRLTLNIGKYVRPLWHPRANSQNHEQGSHRVWKTGKTGKKIMVREKSGKSQGIFILGQKSGKKSGNFCFKLVIAMKICCYSCRLSRMFVTVFTNMKVHMWILKNFCILRCFQVLHQQH